MKVKVIKAFNDVQAKKRREPGETFVVDDVRGWKMIQRGLANEETEKMKTPE